MEFRIPLNSVGVEIVLRVNEGEILFTLVSRDSQLITKTDAESLMALSHFIDALVQQLGSLSNDK